MMKAMMTEKIIRPSVQGSAAASICDTGVGKFATDTPKSNTSRFFR